MAMESQPSRPSTSDQKYKKCWTAWALHRGILKTTFDHPECSNPLYNRSGVPLPLVAGDQAVGEEKKWTRQVGATQRRDGEFISMNDGKTSVVVVCEVRMVSLTREKLAQISCHNSLLSLDWLPCFPPTFVGDHVILQKCWMHSTVPTLENWGPWKARWSLSSDKFWLRKVRRSRRYLRCWWLTIQVATVEDWVENTETIINNSVMLGLLSYHGELGCIFTFWLWCFMNLSAGDYSAWKEGGWAECSNE